METDYFKKTKEKFDRVIPDYGTVEFRKIREDIKKGLEKKENEQILLVRRLRTLVLGDWRTPEQKKLLNDIKNILLQNGYYAETIDTYYDPKKQGSLSQLQVLEYCCMTHQLIVFIDGDGAGTITEQNYLAENYTFHGRLMFFIEESKFYKFKSNPCEYFMSFPTIIRYKKGDLLAEVLTYVSFRIHRLADIIIRQFKSGR